jgi:hypothetical protein
VAAAAGTVQAEADNLDTAADSLGMEAVVRPGGIAEVGTDNLAADIEVVPTDMKAQRLVAMQRDKTNLNSL